MARYQGQVAVFRAIVPLYTAATAKIDFPVASAIDAAALKQWKALGIAPSPLCRDEEFIRRASLDITGTLPSAQAVKAFIAQADPGKRAKLIDELLNRPEYAAFFAIKWADILRNKREGAPTCRLRRSISTTGSARASANNVPYDQFVRGDPRPPAAARDRAAGAVVSQAAQDERVRGRHRAGFPGDAAPVRQVPSPPVREMEPARLLRLRRVLRAGRPQAGHESPAQHGRDAEVVYTMRSGTVSHPKTGESMAPKGLGAAVVQVAAGDDPRQKLVDWLADAKNPFFARALVNRYWAHFFGRGIVDPPDDMRLTNPPSNPELLDGLADQFVKSGYDLKQLIRTICTSRVYGLSSLPNETNAKDRQSFARHYPRRIARRGAARCDRAGHRCGHAV